MDSLRHDLDEFNKAIYQSTTSAESSSKSDILSAAEKVLEKISVLVKSQEQSIPTFSREAYQILKDINKKINSKFNSNEINELTTKILNIQKTLEPTYLCLGILLNTDIPDTNSGVLDQVKVFIKQGFPFIATRSLLNNDDNFDANKSLSNRTEVEMMLLKNQAEWDIYELTDGSDFVLFLPKKLLPEKQGAEKLKALDFVSDSKEIRHITPEEVFKNNEGTKNIDSFFKFFDKNPKINKIFDITGHGEKNCVGSLKEKNYKKFLSFIEKQNCKGLVISSCYAGGEPSLLNMPPKAPDARFIEDKKGHSFLTIVRSIGDFPIYGVSIAEKDTWAFYRRVSNFIELHDQTNLKLKRVLDKSQTKFSDTERFQHQLAKSYFPHSADIPSGFRGVGETGLGFSLTYDLCRIYELMPHQRFNKTTHGLSIHTNELPIISKEFIEVYPLIINCPIRFKSVDPILLSMTPGKAHHFFKQIILFDTPILFLRAVAESQVKEISVAKCFFIEHLDYETPELSMQEITLLILPQMYCCAFKSEGEYGFVFNSDGDISSKLITPLQHALFCQTAISMTKSSEEAIRATSAGQESEKMFIDAFQQSLFYSGKPEEVNNILNLVVNYKESNNNKILELLPKLSLADKEALVFYFLETGKNEIALEIIKQQNIDPNCLSLYGLPLISIALANDCSSLIDYLLEKHVDLAVYDLNRNTPLHLMVKMGKKELIEKVLKDDQYQLDINARDAIGCSAISYALDKPEIFDLLISTGAAINFGNMPILCRLIDINRHTGVNIDDQVDRLLEVGADPNEGIPSAFIHAIESKNPDLVKKLLDNGATPFQKDRGGAIPFIQAILKSSPEIITLLLNSPDCDLNVVDKNGINPLIAALYTKNDDLLTILEQKNGGFPPVLSDTAAQCLNVVLSRLDLELDKDKFFALLKWKKNSLAFKGLVFDYTIKNNPNLLAESISSGFIKPNHLKIDSNQRETFFECICKQQFGNFEKYKNLILEALKKGARVDRALDQSSYSPLLEAALNRDYELVKIILTYTSDISNLESPQIFLENVVASKDSELIKLAYEKLSLSNLHPMMLASELKNDPKGKIFSLFLDLGGDVNENEDVNHALHKIISKGDVELMEVYFEKGAKFPTDELVSRAFLEAISSGKVAMFQLLLDKKLSFNTNLLNTPILIIGYQKGGFEMLKKMFETASNFSLFDPIRENLIAEVISKNDTQTLKWLLEELPEFIDVSKIPDSLLLSIVENDNSELLELLLNHPLITQKKDSIFTKAMISDKGPSLKCIEKLLSLGFDPEKKITVSPFRRSKPIYLAVKNKNIELVKILLKAGIKKSITETDSAGKNSALDLAKENYLTEIAHLLEGAIS